MPRITVLLATHNGRRWLPEQLPTILGQTGVDVTVVALDDMSTDGTFEWLQEQSDGDPRITVLPQQGASGSAAANFYRLMLEVDLSGQDRPDYVAFADQDDRWLPGKLSGQVAVLADPTNDTGSRTAGTRTVVDGVSSNVTAFDAAGKRSLIKKDFPQREFDYLLESPGPGCTFLVTPRLARLCREQLAEPTGLAASMAFHDWLIYGVCRGAGWNWHIQAEPTVDYRQHDDNAFGANSGARSAASRIALITRKWHRGEAIKMAEVALSVAPTAQRAGLVQVLEHLRGRGPRHRIALARMAGRLRRRPRDRALIAVLVLVGIW